MSVDGDGKELAGSIDENLKEKIESQQEPLTIDNVNLRAGVNFGDEVTNETGGSDGVEFSNELKESQSVAGFSEKSSSGGDELFNGGKDKSEENVEENAIISANNSANDSAQDIDEEKHEQKHGVLVSPLLEQGIEQSTLELEQGSAEAELLSGKHNKDITNTLDTKEVDESKVLANQGAIDNSSVNTNNEIGNAPQSPINDKEQLSNLFASEAPETGKLPWEQEEETLLEEKNEEIQPQQQPNSPSFQEIKGTGIFQEKTEPIEISDNNALPWEENLEFTKPTNHPVEQISTASPNQSLNINLADAQDAQDLQEAREAQEAQELENSKELKEPKEQKDLKDMHGFQQGAAESSTPKEKLEFNSSKNEKLPWEEDLDVELDPISAKHVTSNLDTNTPNESAKHVETKEEHNKDNDEGHWEPWNNQQQQQEESIEHEIQENQNQENQNQKQENQEKEIQEQKESTKEVIIPDFDKEEENETEFGFLDDDNDLLPEHDHPYGQEHENEPFAQSNISNIFQESLFSSNESISTTASQYRNRENMNNRSTGNIYEPAYYNINRQQQQQQQPQQQYISQQPQKDQNKKAPKKFFEDLPIISSSNLVPRKKDNPYSSLLEKKHAQHQQNNPLPPPPHLAMSRNAAFRPQSFAQHNFGSPPISHPQPQRPSPNLSLTSSKFSPPAPTRALSITDHSRKVSDASSSLGQYSPVHSAATFGMAHNNIPPTSLNITQGPPNGSYLPAQQQPAYNLQKQPPQLAPQHQQQQYQPQQYVPPPQTQQQQSYQLSPYAPQHQQFPFAEAESGVLTPAATHTARSVSHSQTSNSFEPPPQEKKVSSYAQNHYAPLNSKYAAAVPPSFKPYNAAQDIDMQQQQQQKQQQQHKQAIHQAVNTQNPYGPSELSNGNSVYSPVLNQQQQQNVHLQSPTVGFPQAANYQPVQQIAASTSNNFQAPTSVSQGYPAPPQIATAAPISGYNAQNKAQNPSLPTDGYSRYEAQPRDIHGVSNFTPSHQLNTQPGNVSFIRFSRGKKVVIRNSLKGTIKVTDIDQLISLNSIDKSFGPVKGLTKKKITDYLTKKIEDITKNDPQNFNSLLLFIIANEIVAGDGTISNFTPIIKALDQNAPFNVAMPTNFVPANHQLTALNKDFYVRLFLFLQNGQKKEALDLVLSYKMFDLALILASGIGENEVQYVTSQFLNSYFNDTSPSSRILYFLLHTLTGKAESLIQNLYSDSDSLQFLIENFNLFLSLLLKNVTNANEFLAQFGCLLIRKNRIDLGHICLLLAGIPLSPFPIANTDIVFSLVRSDAQAIENLIITEILTQYAKLPETPESFNQRLVVHVQHASILLDYGATTEARKYTDHVSSLIKSVKNIPISSNVLTELNHINSRVADLGESNWFGNVALGILDKGFTKFISGEESTPKKPHDDTFNNFSPSLSRNQSALDLTTTSHSTGYFNNPHAKSTAFVNSAPASSSNQFDNGTSTIPQDGLSRRGSEIGTFSLNQRSEIAKRSSASLSKHNSNFAAHTPIPATNIPVEGSTTRTPLPNYKSNPNLKGQLVSSLPSGSALSATPSRIVSSNTNSETKYTRDNDSTVSKQVKAQDQNQQANDHSDSKSPHIPEVEAFHHAQQTPSKVTDLPTKPLQNSLYASSVRQSRRSSTISKQPSVADSQSLNPTSNIPSETTSVPVQNSRNASIKYNNPYSNIMANASRRTSTNKYAPAGGEIQKNVEDETKSETENIYASVMNDFDIYSYAGYSVPKVNSNNSKAMEESNNINEELEEVTGKQENSNFAPATLNDNFKADFPEPESHFDRFKPRNSTFTPSVGPYGNAYQPSGESKTGSLNASATDFDDDYDLDVVHDEDEDDEEEEKDSEREERTRKEREDKEKREQRQKEEDRKKNEKEGKQHSGWLFGLFQNPNKDEPKVYKAKLGDSNSFYFDEKLKRWVNKDASSQETESTPPPPPPTIKKKKNSEAPLPPMSFSSTHSSGPSSASPPIAHQNFPSARAKTSSSNELDDILNMASAASTTRKKGRNGPRRGYVDTFNN